ncbi:MAG: aspartate aminotransferase family protein [Immundisolibacter sp.]|nr:aspartate aminotransferase family protein [Immundisolibacter sp.]MDD3652387.1 aspartate aminotransferase family protein [Immundisolibacter sp.]
MSASCLMPTYRRLPVSFCRGRGLRLWDAQGNEYLDAIAGVGVTALGHAHPELAQVIAEQAACVLHTSNLVEIEWQERLARRLCALTGLAAAFFCNSGAEANEAALKLARLHARRRGVTAPLILTLENSFHGRTLATLSATGNPAVKEGFAPLVDGFLHVPADDPAALEAVARSRPEVVAVLLEPVQGEGGVRSLSAAYLQAVRRLCDRHGWLMMVDEVQTGLGRTGAWFGYQHAGVQPDVLTLAKGLGNGIPIGACLAGAAAADLFAPGSHGSTFGGNPLACRVACTVLDILARDDLPRRARRLGERLRAGLQAAIGTLPGVEAIRGPGLMVGIALDRPVDELPRLALERERLLLGVARGGTLRLLPALIASEPDIDDIVARVARLLTGVLRS